MPKKTKNPLLLAWKTELRNRWAWIQSARTKAERQSSLTRANAERVGRTNGRIGHALVGIATRVASRFRQIHLSRPQPGLWVVAIVGIALVVLARGSIAGVAQRAAAHVVVTGAIIAMLVSVLVHRGRQIWSRYYSRGWLATVPMTSRAVTRVVAMRSLLWPGVGVVALTPVSLLTTPALPLLWAVWIGGAGGAMLGWWLPHREPPAPRRPMVYAVAPATRGQLTALTRWPHAQTKLLLPRRTIETLVLLGMLALPMDVSGNFAIASLCGFLVLTYLVALLLATVRVVREGARWLRTTPLPFGRFAWAVLRDPMLRQLQWTLAAGVLLVALGANAVQAARLAEIWLALVVTVSTVTTAQAYSSRPLLMRLAFSLSIVAAAEAIKQLAALPCALFVSAWQMRRGARAQ